MEDEEGFVDFTDLSKLVTDTASLEALRSEEGKLSQVDWLNYLRSLKIQKGSKQYGAFLSHLERKLRRRPIATKSADTQGAVEERTVAGAARGCVPGTSFSFWPF